MVHGVQLARIRDRCFLTAVDDDEIILAVPLDRNVKQETENKFK
jgi:hypothetical protein